MRHSFAREGCDGNVHSAATEFLEIQLAVAEDKSSVHESVVYTLEGDNWRSQIPKDAQFISLLVGDREYPIKDTRELLIRVCTVCSLKNFVDFDKRVRRYSAKWLMPHKYEMAEPYQLNTNWFVDLGGSDTIRLLRTALILTWTWRGPAPMLKCITEVEQDEPSILPTPIEGDNKPTGDGTTAQTGSDNATRPNPQEIDSQSAITIAEEKIGASVKRRIYVALAEDMIPDDEFEKLLTIDGTKELLGASLTTCPLFSFSRMVRRDGRYGCWLDSAMRRGRAVFVNSQWHERHRNKIEQLLLRWEHKTTTNTFVETEFLSKCESQLTELLEAEFVNGIRPSSIIDRNKIRRLYNQYFDEELPEIVDFNVILPRIGIVYDGKVFPRPSSKGGGWRTLIERLVEQGHTVFQFSRFMERHASELMHIGIVSPEMLCETMTHEAQDTYEISGELFGQKGPEPLDMRFSSLVLPQEGSIIDIVAVSKRIPYVDIVFIRNFCRGLDLLVRISQDLYAIVSRVEFDDTETSRGKSQCESAIQAEGFFSLSQLCLNDSVAMNDRRIVDSALRRVFFQRFLSERFDIHGQIVCSKGANMDGQVPLHAFLREHSDVSLVQIETLAKEYNIAPWLL